MQELKRWNAVRSTNQCSVCIPRHTWWTVGELGFGGALNAIAAALGMESHRACACRTGRAVHPVTTLSTEHQSWLRRSRR